LGLLVELTSHYETFQLGIEIRQLGLELANSLPHNFSLSQRYDKLKLIGYQTGLNYRLLVADTQNFAASVSWVSP
jgi:hypothetical protein